MKKAIRFLLPFFILLLLNYNSYCWGFYAHQKINYYAVFLLPPEMMLLYKPNISFLSEHAIDPDKRRYAVPDEGPRHYIDIDHYGVYLSIFLVKKCKDKHHNDQYQYNASALHPALHIFFYRGQWRVRSGS